ncbi:hypothetical protein FIBSPDRAFT_884650 [Athelia psychrophila]|uniref:Uncharacterized protein n=1 Tax=Athelia psychrophila TaxID=1759441 RepID=A0A166SZ67_9AGAM|nr:hypothetical protein FIBSPDRAFT_884650 [Fibularhizoctonia sp. CBS 109695]
MAWKESVEKAMEMHGEEAMISRPLAELLPLLSEETEHNITSAGGLEVYQSLSADKQDSLKLHTSGLFVKGWNTAMVALWPKAGIPGPMKLLNRDNTAAANLEAHALDVSQAGGIKLTSSAGHIFANKDKKKGQQDTFKYELESAIGYMLGFPDTSNTRYQTHCKAAGELISQLHFYHDFMETIRDLKEKQTCTNIEHNFLFSAPSRYFIHSCVKFEAQMLLQPTWSHHIFQECTRDIECFTRELSADSVIASASASEKKRAFMRRTNDDNEGTLGEMRVDSQHAPSMTLQQHNARKMYWKNGVAAFICSCLSAEDMKYLRRRTREIDSSGIAKKEHNANTTAHKATILVKWKANKVQMTV